MPPLPPLLTCWSVNHSSSVQVKGTQSGQQLAFSTPSYSDGHVQASVCEHVHACTHARARTAILAYHIILAGEHEEQPG